MGWLYVGGLEKRWESMELIKTVDFVYNVKNGGAYFSESTFVRYTNGVSLD